MTLFTGIDTGALQPLGAILATHASSTGLGSRKNGTLGLGEVPLVVSNLTTLKILWGENFIVGESSRRTRKRRTRAWAPYGMGHGFKNLTKMVFAPRLPQSWQGGVEQEHLVIDPLYNRQKP